MAQRTVALYNGKYIGIETIYTVINGQQINIPDKLKELREKSQSNELFCPCGCGTNLILVAGDKKLREQHFREKAGTGEYECSMPLEGKTSVDSKIVLKCWLDDKLKVRDIESRVPIDTFEDIKRRSEFTFLTRSKKLGIRYWRTRANIADDRLEVLTDNLSGINVIYIVDSSNGGTDGQYPESLMKLQEKQGFCLLLDIEGADYSKVYIRAVFYGKDIDGLWKENEFISDKLSRVEIIDNQLFFNGEYIKNLLEQAKEKFSRKQIEEKDKRIWKQREDATRHRKELEEIYCIEAERLEQEKLQREEDFKKNMESSFAQQEIQVWDADGNRWIKCEFCGKIAKESEFTSYGGPNHKNLGTCKECSDNNPMVKKKIMQEKEIQRKKYDLMMCPVCGGKLRERRGFYGKFYGCINYPKCRYSKSINI